VSFYWTRLFRVRLTKRLREEAAVFASAIAGSDASGVSSRQIAEALGVSIEAADLYFDAWSYATEAAGVCTASDPRMHDKQWDAEAECLLRTGWSP
jgi:purine-nucleoside phosphorylase